MALAILKRCVELLREVLSVSAGNDRRQRVESIPMKMEHLFLAPNPRPHHRDVVNTESRENRLIPNIDNTIVQ